MTRIFVPRGSSGSSSSSNQNRPPQASSSQSRDEEQDKDSTFTENPSITEITDQIPDQNHPKIEDLSSEIDQPNPESSSLQNPSSQLTESLSQINLTNTSQSSSSIGSSSSSSQPPAPPIPPPKPSQSNSNNNLRRLGSGTPPPPTNNNNNNSLIRIGPSRRWAPQQASSESDGYNSADEHAPSLKPSNYADAERERMFEIELRRVKGYEIRRMIQDGNCLFRAVADQVYGDPETFDLSRQMAVDYMERERDHFSQFITEGFTSYCKRKRRDKVYGNNVEIQAFAEMYNRPIHIYSYSTEPINIFQGSYDTDTPPIRLSYHHGNHYNSLIDPRRLNVGAGLGFSSLRGVSADRDQVKAAIKAQQDQHIDNALIAEGRFYSDMELTEKEIERMVMEASRAEYLKQQNQTYFINNSSGAEPSSSATIIGPSRAPPSVERVEENKSNKNNKLTGSMELLMAMGFSYMQVIEAYSIFGDDVDSMICYLVEMGATSADSHRRKGKAAE